MKITKQREFEETACDICGATAAVKCHGCGKDLCGTHAYEGEQVHTYTLSSFSLERKSLLFCSDCTTHENRHYLAARRISTAAKKAETRLKELHARILKLSNARDPHGWRSGYERLSARNSIDGKASAGMALPPPARGPCGLIFRGIHCENYDKPECGACPLLAAARLREQQAERETRCDE